MLLRLSLRKGDAPGHEFRCDPAFCRGLRQLRRGKYRIRAVFITYGLAVHGARLFVISHWRSRKELESLWHVQYTLYGCVDIYWDAVFNYRQQGTPARTWTPQPLKCSRDNSIQWAAHKPAPFDKHL
ncbi:hypothetical protein NDU88_011335 [Pleurodeles waltl]|uniref:Uncharacterized protein n=1 Tax=Pleurodeles waltl TaxID=8319 RepID=A0AAV7S3U6_PLEWA|nr:hypothetical protein NDU88_011335 [Pleurodeles waltl]